MSYWKMANLLEQSSGVEAMIWWRRAYEVLSGIKAGGLFLSPSDENELQQLRAKVGG